MSKKRGQQPLRTNGPVPQPSKRQSTQDSPSTTHLLATTSPLPPPQINPNPPTINKNKNNGEKRTERKKKKKNKNTRFPTPYRRVATRSRTCAPDPDKLNKLLISNTASSYDAIYVTDGVDVEDGDEIPTETVDFLLQSLGYAEADPSIHQTLASIFIDEQHRHNFFEHAYAFTRSYGTKYIITGWEKQIPATHVTENPGKQQHHQQDERKKGQKRSLTPTSTSTTSSSSQISTKITLQPLHHQGTATQTRVLHPKMVVFNRLQLRRQFRSWIHKTITPQHSPKRAQPQLQL
jgi:hypothetical protein